MVEETKVYGDVKEDPFYRIHDFKSRVVETEGAYIFETRVPDHERKTPSTPWCGSGSYEP